MKATIHKICSIVCIYRYVHVAIYIIYIKMYISMYECLINATLTAWLERINSVTLVRPLL